MVEARMGEGFEAGADAAALGIVGAVDEAGSASLDQRAGAHGAGLDGYVQSGTSEAVVAKEACGFAKDDDFGMGGGVIVADGAIAGAREDFAVVDKHGADGDFAGCGRETRFG